MSTYLQLCQYVAAQANITGDGLSGVTNQTGDYARVVRWVADADESIQLAFSDWKFLWKQWTQAVTANDNDYAVPTDLGVFDLESFYMDYSTDSYQWLEYKPYEEYRIDDRNGTVATGDPTEFTIRPDNAYVILIPKPTENGSLTADYWKKPTRLAANSDESAIPSRFHRLIEIEALALYAAEREANVFIERFAIERAELWAKLKAAQLDGQEHGRKAKHQIRMVVRPQ